MYLKEIEGQTPPAAAGRFAAAIQGARAAGHAVPQIWHLFAARPGAAKGMCDFMQDLMRGPAPILPGERELIAAWTSARNHCLF